MSSDSFRRSYKRISWGNINKDQLLGEEKLRIDQGWTKDIHKKQDNLFSSRKKKRESRHKSPKKY